MEGLLARLEQAEGFDWDEGNLAKSWERHRVRFSECEEVFANRPLLASPVEGHSGREERFAALGRTDTGRLLFVVFTFRRGSIRVISARDMSRREREEFQRGEKAQADPAIP